MLSENATLDEIKEMFTNDCFATEACGAFIVDARKGYAKCAFDIKPVHLNAAGAVMGGAIFTLADFTLAIACNIGEKPTVSVNNNIQYLSSSKGTRLYAECTLNKSGSAMGFYTVSVTDDKDELIALMSATCYRKSNS